MNIQVFPTADLASKYAADLIVEAVNNNPTCVLGLATGNTPLKAYEYLIVAYKNGLDLSQVTTFNLDEFVGIPASHPHSFRTTMNEVLFNHTNVNILNTHVPDGNSEDLEQEVVAYETAIFSKGGIELQLLGIGKNGHIGFNEPGTLFDTYTSIINLTEQTRKQYQEPFGLLAHVPLQGITMGIKTIMNSKHAVLLALGTDKAQIIKKSLQDFITEDVPASILQKHPNLTVVLDSEAASLL